jgi:hypothetical protein
VKQQKQPTYVAITAIVMLLGTLSESAANTISQIYVLPSPVTLTPEGGPVFAFFDLGSSYSQFDDFFLSGAVTPGSGFVNLSGVNGIAVEWGIVYNGTIPLPPCCTHTESWGVSS